MARAYFSTIEAAQQAALYNYAFSIQNAFGDVDNALVANSKLKDQLAAQERLVAALKDYSRLAKLQYDGGYAPYSTVLQAEQTLFPAELTLAAVRAIGAGEVELERFAHGTTVATNHLLEQGPGHAECGSAPVALCPVATTLIDPGTGAVDPNRAQLLQPAPSRRIVLASGNASGIYHRFAQRYVEILKRDGVTVEERMTAGATENHPIDVLIASPRSTARTRDGSTSQPARAIRTKARAKTRATRA